MHTLTHISTHAHPYLHTHPHAHTHTVALTGTSFIALTEQYISAICDGGVPTITSAWSEVMQKECEDARYVE